MASKNNPTGRKKDIITQQLKGEVLIYDLQINKAYCLNETSALIWQECDGTKSAAEIARIITRKLNKPADESLVWLAIDQLKKENLLANSEQINTEFEGASRREAIKKIGLATMIALPVISSLVAPTAAAAQSATACQTAGQSCTVQGDCCAGLICEGTCFAI